MPQLRLLRKFHISVGYARKGEKGGGKRRTFYWLGANEAWAQLLHNSCVFSPKANAGFGITSPPSAHPLKTLTRSQLGTHSHTHTYTNTTHTHLRWPTNGQGIEAVCGRGGVSAVKSLQFVLLSWIMGYIFGTFPAEFPSFPSLSLFPHSRFICAARACSTFHLRSVSLAVVFPSSESFALIDCSLSRNLKQTIEIKFCFPFCCKQ